MQNHFFQKSEVSTKFGLLRHMVRFKFGAQLVALIIGHPVEPPPEIYAVVHFLSVAKLVQYHVVDQVCGKQHQVKRQVDALTTGATAPAAFARLYLYFRKSEPVLFGQLAGACRQKPFGFFFQKMADAVPEISLHMHFGAIRTRGVFNLQYLVFQRKENVFPVALPGLHAECKRPQVCFFINKHGIAAQAFFKRVLLFDQAGPYGVYKPEGFFLRSPRWQAYLEACGQDAHPYVFGAATVYKFNGS